jgi:hypothetical protein
MGKRAAKRHLEDANDIYSPWFAHFPQYDRAGETPHFDPYLIKLSTGFEENSATPASCGAILDSVRPSKVHTYKMVSDLPSG